MRCVVKNVVMNLLGITRYNTENDQSVKGLGKKLPSLPRKKPGE